MSTVPIFKVPCARAAIGRTSKETSVKESNFFIRGLNRSSETVQTASGNIQLKLIADAKVEMAVLCISGRVNGISVIETQRPNRQIQPETNAEIRSETIERASWRRQQWIEWQVILFCKLDAGLDVEAAWFSQCFYAEIPWIRID